MMPPYVISWLRQAEKMRTRKRACRMRRMRFAAFCSYWNIVKRAVNSMTGYKVKPGVIMEGLKKPMLDVIPIIADIYNRYSATLVITSALDGKHKNGSFHYLGLAIDTRIWAFDAATLPAVLADLRSALGPKFDVVLEGNHFHIERDTTRCRFLTTS